MRAALARAPAAALPGDPPQPARRLLRDRLLPARAPQADDDRDGTGMARIRGAVFPAAASELAQRAVDAAEPVVRGRGAARTTHPRACGARKITRKITRKASPRRTRRTRRTQRRFDGAKRQ